MYKLKDGKDNNKMQWLLVFPFLLLFFWLIEQSPVSSACYQDPDAKHYLCYAVSAGYHCLSQNLTCSESTCTDDSGCSKSSCEEHCPYVGEDGVIYLGPCRDDISGGCLCNANSCNSSCTPPTCASQGWHDSVSGATCSKKFHCYGVSECLTGNLICGTRTCYKSDECSCNQGCDEGYYDKDTGYRCKGPSTCSCTTECGNPKELPKQICWLPETNNTNPPDPTSIELILDRRKDPNSNVGNVWVSSGNLSTNPATPTRVKLPMVLPNSTRVPKIAKPSGARELRYLIGGTYSTEEYPDNHDFMYRLGYPEGLTEGSTGSVTARHETLNECDDGVRLSNERRGYYKVNTLPSSINVSLSGIPNTTDGCTADVSFTGKEANNPLIVEITGEDADGISDINGAILWFVKEGYSISDYLNQTYWLGGGETRSDPNRIGLFFPKGGQVVYKANNYEGVLDGWGRDAGPDGVGNSRVQDSDRKEIITNVNVLEEGAYLDTTLGRLRYKIKLEVTFPPDSPMLGKYQVYAGFSDIFSYGQVSNQPYTYLDLKNIVSKFTWKWNFDFINPLISNYTAEFDNLEQRIVEVKWQSSDVGSSVKDTVVNVQKLNIKDGDQVERVFPWYKGGNIITLQPFPDENSIGNISPLISGWYYEYLLDETKISIMDNEQGHMAFWVTIYDQACNRYRLGDDNLSDPPPVIDLNKWIATKGGIFFSAGRVGYDPKEQNPNIENYNTGSELITVGVDEFPNTLNLGDLYNPTLVKSVTDINHINRERLFDVLKKKIIEKRQELDDHIVIDDLSKCSAGKICYLGFNLRGEIVDQDITLGREDGSVTEYAGKILVVTNGDINVHPDIKAQNPASDGLVLFAGGNININSFSKSGPGTLYYDQLEMLMLAKERINIPKETLNQWNQQDGLKVFGSVIGLGVGDLGYEPAVFIERNLGLQNPFHPVLIVNYHPKYTNISEVFFGTETYVYKQEVGFKI